MSGPRQETRAFLEVEYPGAKPWYIDEVKEFVYVSDMMAIGDTCSFTIVADSKGETLRKLPLGALVRLKLMHPKVNGGRWTLKHLGRIVLRDASLNAGTIQVVSADLGWHLTACCGPLYKRFRGLKLGDIVRPGAGFIDPTFGFQGVRVGDANLLNRRIKQGRAFVQVEQQRVLDVLNVVQCEPGETFYDVLTRYAVRENLLLSVTADGFIQLWNPDYERAPVYSFEASDVRSNITDARRHDEAASRYSEVTVVGEALALGVQMNDPNDPNATKRRGHYRAPLGSNGLPSTLPFVHRLTAGDSEMLDSAMAKAAAEWRWKRGLFDSHYVEIDVADHYQLAGDGGRWLESDELADLKIPGLSLEGRYYVQSVACSSTVKDGDTAKIVLRWPHLLSAAYGVWGTRPMLSDPADTLALLPGVGEGQ